MHDEQRNEQAREKALKHPMRVAIIDMLSSANGSGLTSVQIREHLPDLPPLSEVAYHLGVLAEPGLVARDDDGRFTVA